MVYADRTELYGGELDDGTHFCGGYALMQFSGLKDRKGRDIYEGDVLKYLYRSASGYKGRGQVVYEAPGFRVKGDDLDMWLGHAAEKHREVIGNIYENPELLNQSRD